MSLVRMTHPRLGVRHVRTVAVGKMRQNGWQVAELGPPAGEVGVSSEPPPTRKRRRSSSASSEAPEQDSGAFSRPETEQEGSS